MYYIYIVPKENRFLISYTKTYSERKGSSFDYNSLNRKNKQTKRGRREKEGKKEGSERKTVLSPSSGRVGYTVLG